jgi:hypothetical protein
MVRSVHIGTWVSAVVLVGCQVFDPALLDESRSFSAAIARDGGPPSARPVDSDGCTDSTELCNDEDDDCDGEVDENADDSCRLPHAVGGCGSGGSCVIADCERGFLDCNSRSSDGCEQSTGGLQCGMCGTGCADDGGLLLPDASVQVGANDAAAGDVDEVDLGGARDAGQMTGGNEPGCVAGTETCNQRDDDCDDRVDEAPADCALEACVASTPSYRGAGCDRCVCRRCAMLVGQCQNHMDARWAMLCRDVTECYVIRSRAGECGTNGDCYGSGNGPCAGEIRLASGGSSETDSSRVTSGCAVASPPSTACAAVSAYRNECTRELCADECAD